MIEGLDKWQSRHGAPETVQRLKAAIAAAKLTLFAEIDHTAGARAVGLDLPYTTVLIFGSPTAGTPLMAAAPSLAIDLPLKALVWQAGDGSVWIGCNAPTWLGARHHLPSSAAAALAAIYRLQSALAAQASH